MHFWIDKRSSQLHQYGGGGRRGPGGAGGFYSQNFGTHRNHPPPSLGGHHHPHRLRTRTSSTTNAIPSGSGSSATSANNNNNAHSSTNSSNNNHHQPSSTVTTSSASTNGNNSSSSAATIALQYPHQQPHQVQQQHAMLQPGTAGAIYSSGNSSGNPSQISSVARYPGRTVEAYRNGNTIYSHSSHQPILGGGILAISGSSSNAANAGNTPMTIVSGDDVESGGLTSTTVLTFPPPNSGVAVNHSNSINVQLISCVNINPESRGGIDLSWRNPYHVPGSSISRCRAYSRDTPPSLAGAASAPSSSRGTTRGRRTSSSSSSGLGRGSLGTVPGTSSNHSQNAANETPEGMTDRSTRSERTSFDRDTATPQRSLSLTSPETGGEQSSRGTSTGGRPSLDNDPGWACTKRVGLTLCFLAFILLGTVGAKFMIQGPGVIDTGKAEAAAYFLFTELIFVAFAMALFFTGVACLRKRTNDYLLRQFNQYIMNSSATTGVSGGQIGTIPGQDAFDFEYYDGAHPPVGGGSPSSRGHHHHLHHNLHHGGFHGYRHHPSNGSLIEEGDFGNGGELAQSPHNFHGAGPIHYPAHYGGGSNAGGRHGRSKPPPYHIALYLPLPELGGGGGNTPTEENINNNEQDGGKFGGKDGIGFIDTSGKDAQDTAPGLNVTFSNNSNENRDSRNGGEGSAERDNRTETPPPPYEQL